MSARLLLGDCLESMRAMPDNSVDSLVCDPPAGISFMGRSWDGDKGGRRQWVAWLAEVLSEARRVVKPGGHALVWALPRTSHWTGWAAEEAGWEVRDNVAHCFWSGMPKGGSIGSRIDAMAGAEREVVGHRDKVDSFGDGAGNHVYGGGPDHGGRMAITAPATPEAAKWEGWHTHLKPAYENWWLLRKPLAESSIARQVLATGTGALHIDACRFAQGSSEWPGPQEGKPAGVGAYVPNNENQVYGAGMGGGEWIDKGGRYPANLVHFAKPSRAEKERGCEGLPPMLSTDVTGREPGSPGQLNGMSGMTRRGDIRNHHPTPKPIALMRWLVRLVTPDGGTCLDCFMGSGTTGVACKLEGFDFIGCELDPAYLDIARARIKHAAPGQEVEGGNDHEPDGPYQPGLFG